MHYVYAQSDRAREAAQGFLARMNDIILYPLIALLLGVALVYFLYGAFEYVRNADSPGGRETGRRHMMWGIVGLFVMTSALAIHTIAANTFPFQGMADPQEYVR